ncbi:MAG: hypothetical protein PVG49_18040 [Desulfobacteraceae bacterium]|jgi:hypothetical protein
MTTQVALVIVGCVFSALLTFAVIYLREIKDGLKEQMGHHNELRQELSDLKETLPKDYVRREDWIMSFGKIEQKIDAIWAFVHEHVKERSDGSREEAS